MVESGRKHGPFDFRYPAARKIAAPEWDVERSLDGQRVLGWYGFLARFFPNAHRHDFEALAAYEAYRKALAAPTTPLDLPKPQAFPGSRRTSRRTASPRPRAGRVGAPRTAAPVRTPSPAVANWESEGGSYEHNVD